MTRLAGIVRRSPVLPSRTVLSTLGSIKSIPTRTRRSCALVPIGACTIHTRARTSLAFTRVKVPSIGTGEALTARGAVASEACGIAPNTSVVHQVLLRRGLMATRAVIIIRAKTTTAL